MKKNYLPIIIMSLIIVGLLGVIMVLKFGSEDSWICQNGQWIKHGHPSSSMPTTGCGIQANTNTQPSADNNLAPELQPYATQLENDLAGLITSWQKYLPDLKLASFTKTGEQEISEQEWPYQPNFLREQIIGVYSPDKTKYVDPAIYTEVFFQEDGSIDFASDIDNGVNLIDLKKATIKNLLSCGTPCSWSDAYWLNDQVFIVTGQSEDYPGGYDKCYAENNCTIVATLDLFDLQNDKHYLFKGPGVIQDIFWQSIKPADNTDPYAEYRQKINDLIKQGVDLRPKIIVESPNSFETISSPVTITGQARGNWYFEATFPIKLVGESGQEIGTAIAQAQEDWMTEKLVPFKATLEFKTDKDQYGTIILMNDNPSGLPELRQEYQVPVEIKAKELLNIKIFLGNEQKNPGAEDCAKVFPVERQITKTVTTARVSLEELLKGPTEEEKAQSYSSSINSGVKLNKITIKDNIAYADFDSQLGYQVGGSCEVTAIRAQITETLKQFSSINNVVISIDGLTEDILQP
jgi:hypothetical protein